VLGGGSAGRRDGGEAAERREKTPARHDCGGLEPSAGRKVSARPFMQ
jgi:hypothetical protein